MTLRELKIGQSATVVSVGGDGALRQHFLDMGIIPGAEVRLVKFAPMGDPMQLLVHGYELTLRLADAGNIGILPVSENGEKKMSAPADDAPQQTHPRYGENFVLDMRRTPHVPIEGKISFALVGNQNCGKTTLFNQLTGANQHVGNFPGVTVDRKSGVIRGYAGTEVTDLPGIYSLSPYTKEEIVSREFILNEKPAGIINIVDASNIERNLYLTMQLMELDIPMVLALNMMDEVRNNGGTIRINEMEAMLGIPVVPISAMRNEGVDELISHAVHVAKYHELPAHDDFCDPNDHGGAVHRSLHAIMHLVEDHALAAGIPLRFAAGKLVEGDKLVTDALALSENEIETVNHILRQMQDERGLDAAAAMADMRFAYIRKVCEKTVVRPRETKEHARSRRIDRILTGRFTALPAFVLLMMLVFWLTFDVIGGSLQTLLESGIGWCVGAVDRAFSAWDINDVLHSLVVDGIFTGVGTVLSFLPIIVTLFFFLSMLEDSGYMARIAFVMDSLLRKIGLSGRSIVPLLVGFGCSVPSVMACRTLPSERDRKLTIMLTPFMSCTAKLPIYAFFVAAFFPERGGLVMTSIYFIGIFIGILVAMLLKKTVFRGEPVPFVMELPNYRIPGARSVARLLWEKSKDFLERAFTVIFVAAIVIWFLQTFNFRLQLVGGERDSMLSAVAGFVAPVFEPLGFGDWRIVTSLVSGFIAKESVVSTLTVLFGGVAAVQSALSATTAFALMVFCLLYTPCVAAVATIRRELGGRCAFSVVVWQCVLAWICAWAAKVLFGFFS